MNGDFNMRDMRYWSENEIRTHLEKINNRENNGSVIGSTPVQIKLLCEMVQEHFLHQVIKHNTRKNNLIDLVFCNDDELFHDQTVMENILLSDHNIIILKINITKNKMTEDSKENIYSTTIPSYNLLMAEDLEWKNLNDLLQSYDWENIFENHSVDEIVDLLINITEEGIKSTLNQRASNKCKTNMYGDNYS